MKRITLLSCVALLMMGAPRNTNAQEISFAVFHSSLAPFGEWVDVGGYGLCWRPAGVPMGWRPYTYGHWIWTDYGWTWVSDYPWGWAPFHYGRWALDSYYGWVWVPGYVWAPAWVQWRWGGGYCGWAPLPPGFHFRVDVVVGPDDRNFGVGIGGWSFIHAREMGSPRYRFLDRDAVPRVIGDTRNVTRFRFTQRGVYSVGLPKADVERFTRRRINTVEIIRSNRESRQRVVGNRINIYSPAPFEPRVRNEQEVIRRERTYQTPERFHPGQSNQVRPHREISQPRVEQNREAPRVERRRADSVTPRRDATQRGKQEARQRDRERKDNKGPGHRH